MAMMMTTDAGPAVEGPALELGPSAAITSFSRALPTMFAASDPMFDRRNFVALVPAANRLAEGGVAIASPLLATVLLDLPVRRSR